MNILLDYTALFKISWAAHLTKNHQHQNISSSETEKFVYFMDS